MWRFYKMSTDAPVFIKTTAIKCNRGAWMFCSSGMYSTPLLLLHTGNNNHWWWWTVCHRGTVTARIYVTMCCKLQRLLRQLRWILKLLHRLQWHPVISPHCEARGNLFLPSGVSHGYFCVQSTHVIMIILIVSPQCPWIDVP